MKILIINLILAASLSSAGAQTVVSCKEVGARSVYVEVEVHLKNGELFLSKYMNHEGGVRTIMASFLVEAKEETTKIKFDSIKNLDSLQIIKGEAGSVMKEIIMNSSHETKLKCEFQS